MAIYRGLGGAGDSTTDATITEVTTLATNAAASASASLSAKVAAETAKELAEEAKDDARKLAINPEDSQFTLSDATTGYSALHHKEKALDAQGAAETAKGLAEDARDAAVSAQGLSEGARDAAVIAQGLSEGARDASVIAQGLAEGARDAAVIAQGLAEGAKDDAIIAKDAAEAAQTATESLFTQFGDQYLGSKAAEPTLDNSGNALTEGDVFWDSTNNVLKFYTGTAWVAPEDVATTAASDALSYSTNAFNSASNAATSETNAGNSAVAAAASATSASNSATVASGAATDANTSEANAYVSELNAASSASNASNSATSASNSATSAAASASSAVASASNAATSETNAATSASNAATSETNAAASAASVLTSETNAAASAASAATSATNAASSASTASTSASNAAISEANAATSETNAASSASTASTSASNAAISEANAATSATNAATSETNASNSATAAATSATAAATSATEASTYVADQTGNAGKYLTTDGSSVSWADAGGLPSQTGNTGKVLTTDGSTATWEYSKRQQTNNSGLTFPATIEQGIEYIDRYSQAQLYDTGSKVISITPTETVAYKKQSLLGNIQNNQLDLPTVLYDHRLTSATTFSIEILIGHYPNENLIPAIQFYDYLGNLINGAGVYQIQMNTDMKYGGGTSTYYSRTGYSLDYLRLTQFDSLSSSSGNVIFQNYGYFVRARIDLEWQRMMVSNSTEKTLRIETKTNTIYSNQHYSNQECRTQTVIYDPSGTYNGLLGGFRVFNAYNPAYRMRACNVRLIIKESNSGSQFSQ